MTCSRCGRKLTDEEPGHLIYPTLGLRLCDLCNDKAEQCTPKEDDDAIHSTDDP